MRWADLLAAIVVTAWGYLLIEGIGGLLDINARHVPGYPAYGQLILYAGIPTLFLLLLALVVVLSRKVSWFYDAYPFAIGLVGFCSFPVLMVWSGGV